MSQIIGGHTFVPLERNIDDVKLNSITGGATITTELISTQTQATSSATGDQYLILKSGAGNLNRILHDDLVTSIGTSPSFQTSYGNFRLRSFSSIGNGNFSVDQRNVGTVVNLAAGSASPFIQDRWQLQKVAATMTLSAQQIAQNVVVPGTNFYITGNVLKITLGTVQATLAAGEYVNLTQYIEGPLLRELLGDTHSVSLLVSCSQPITFSLNLKSATGTAYSLTKRCTISSANTWTLISLPNLPVFAAGGTWPLTPGAAGYLLGICLGAGSTFTSPADDTWQAGNFLGGSGITNIGSLPTGTTFSIAAVQHEPGPNATQLIDKPFTQNLDEVARYYQKSYDYAAAVAAVSANGQVYYTWPAGSQPIVPVRFPKRMAKVPTLLLYSPATGTSNNVRDNTANADKGITTNRDPSESGFNGANIGTPNAGAWQGSFHYTADTGL